MLLLVLLTLSKGPEWVVPDEIGLSADGPSIWLTVSGAGGGCDKVGTIKVVQWRRGDTLHVDVKGFSVQRNTDPRALCPAVVREAEVQIDFDEKWLVASPSRQLVVTLQGRENRMRLDVDADQRIIHFHALELENLLYAHNRIQSLKQPWKAMFRRPANGVLDVTTFAPIIAHGVGLGDVEKVMSEKRPEILRCYEQAFSFAPAIQGDVTFNLTLAGEKVTSVTHDDKKATLRSRRVTSCVNERLTRWTFPSSQEPTGVITLPLRFTAAGVELR